MNFWTVFNDLYWIFNIYPLGEADVLMPELHFGQMGRVLKLCDQFFESTTCASDVKIAIALKYVSLYKRYVEEWLVSK